MSVEIDNRFRSLEVLVLVASDKKLDEQLASYLSKLACVQICGNIERSLEILITDRVAKRSTPQIGLFMKAYFRQGTNYTCDRIQKLLANLDKTWAKKFEEYLNANTDIKESVASCYATRNAIAHGESKSLGPGILRQYLEHSLSLVAKIESIIK